MNRILLSAVLVMAGAAATFAQQTLILNSGARIPGRYDGGKADTVYFIDEHGNRHKFNLDEIQSLVFNGTAPPTSEISERYTPDATPPPFEERGYADTDVEPNAGWTRHAVIPSGTEIVVRTVDPIDVRRPDPRRHFLATIERDVLDANGDVVIPQGSPAHLIVHDVGDGEVAVDLRSVSVNGQRYIVNSENIIDERVREGIGANQRTGKFVGGGALLGTIIGAVAGGGKGAAIGAITGGAAGAGTQVLTRGASVHIPSETVLTFRLDHPVYLFQ